MVVLGIDTATSELTVAATRSSDLVDERSVPADESGRPRHARELLPAIEAVVDEAGGWPQIERIAVGIGPGTFTGLRIGVATVRALGQARKLPLVTVSSLAALAAGVPVERAPGRPRLAMIDAKRNEVFAALFDPVGARLWRDAVSDPEALAQRISELPTAPIAVGDGALRFQGEVAAAGALVAPADDPANRLDARHVCRLGMSGRPVGLEQVEPNYLRRPDAELWRERISQG